MMPTTEKAKLIICCDGTACSEFIQKPNSSLTNVSRFARAIKTFDGDGIRQLVLYLPGIGTAEGNRFNKLNHATGKGLNNLILEAYTFLCLNRGTPEDEIILLGFSRGAFAMRCLADFIIKYGILPKAELTELHTNFGAWKQKGEGNPDTCNKVKIKVCALWDTVATMGLRNPIKSKGRYPFVNSLLHANIENAFQALSLHEHRCHFHPLVWKRDKDVKSKLEQCWFAGFHGDVGGGDKEGALAHFALVWLVSKLSDFLSIEKKDLWYRESAITAWTAPGKVLPVPDPSRWYYKLGARLHRSGGYLLHPSGGDLYRRPRCQFRTLRGFVDGPEPDNCSREEQMHSSLRFLVINECVKDSKLCVGRDGRKWIFSKSKRLHPEVHRPPPRENDKYSVYEETLKRDEETILSEWAKQQHKDLYSEGNVAYSVGGPQANTIALKLQHWLAEEIKLPVEVTVGVPVGGEIEE